MKKFCLTMLFVMTFFTASAASASAVVNDMVKVGLKFGPDALFSANLENHVGCGYSFGYFDDAREFIALGETEEMAISMTAAGTVWLDGSGTYSANGGDTCMGPWRLQIDGLDSFQDAEAVANELGGWPAWIDEMYVVRFGCFESREEAEAYMLKTGLDAYDAYSVECASTGIIVTETKTDRILFEYDYWGIMPFGVMPDGEGEKAVTWFKGYKYYGGFEYARITGGNLNVCNLVELEDYVKGVVPHEMSYHWPEEALKAQAVCARSYVSAADKHLSTYGFDVCNTNDCQVYYGLNGATAETDAAVDATEGECLYYDGELAGEVVYHSSNGGATEDVANVWGGKIPYLVGKEDPYEALIAIPSYNWSVTYTAQELTWILEQKGYQVGTVKNVYVSEYTPMGNVKKLTIEGSKKTQTVSGNTCSTIFYSSTYNKSVKSMRFGINGGGSVNAPGIYINDDGNKVAALKGISVISGTGELSKLDGSAVSALTADGLSEITSGDAASGSAGSTKKGTFLIEGAGSGHNVGMSQYGARAMAENGYDYYDILTFYYTGVEVY